MAASHRDPAGGPAATVEGFNRYILDYLQRQGYQQSAATFQAEAEIDVSRPVLLTNRFGFVFEWWTLFCDVYRAARQLPASSPEARAFVVRTWERQERGGRGRASRLGRRT